MQFLFFLPDLAVRGRVPGICVASLLLIPGGISFEVGLFSGCFGEIFPRFGDGSFNDFSGEIERGLV